MADADEDSDAEDDRRRAAQNDDFFAERRRERAEAQARRAEERARKTPEDAARREEVMREWERGVHEANAREAEREARRREAQPARDEDKGKADAIAPADDGEGEPEAFYSADDKGADGQDDDQEGPKQGRGERGGDGQEARRGHDRDHENPRAEDDRGWYDVFDPSSIVFNARRRVLQRKHHDREAEGDEPIPSDRREREYKSQPSAVRHERSHDKPRAEDERGWYDVFDPSSIVFNARRRVLRGGSHEKARERHDNDSEDRKEEEGDGQEERSGHANDIDQPIEGSAFFLSRCETFWRDESHKLKEHILDCNGFFAQAIDVGSIENVQMVKLNSLFTALKLTITTMLKIFFEGIGENLSLTRRLMVPLLETILHHHPLGKETVEHFVDGIRRRIPGREEDKRGGTVRNLGSKSDKQQAQISTRMKSGKKARSKGQTSRHRKTGGNTNADPDGAKILSVAAQRNLERMGYKAWLP